MDKLVSVIIPNFNEENAIKACLQSLGNQTYREIEIIVVDDGSTDKTLNVVQNFKSSFAKQNSNYRAISNVKILSQKHLGPGLARNLGAKNAKGEILVFVDADMTFDKDFIKDLVSPILKVRTIGTFSKNEMNANKDNIWSVCWNINRNWPIDRLIPPDYPKTAPVYRAILKSEFEKVGGFDATGEYTDDWSLCRKLGQKSTLAKGAIYYHSNPDDLKEVFKQARWIGKNEFITGNFIRIIRSLFFYSLPTSLIIGIYKSIINLKVKFIIFKLVYDSAIFTSVCKSFLKEPKAK